MKGKHLHKLAKELLAKFPSRFTGDFAANKVVLREMDLLKGSKEEFNKLAGEIAILMGRTAPAAA